MKYNRFGLLCFVFLCLQCGTKTKLAEIATQLSVRPAQLQFIRGFPGLEEKTIQLSAIGPGDVQIRSVTVENDSVFSLTTSEIPQTGVVVRESRGASVVVRFDAQVYGTGEATIVVDSSHGEARIPVTMRVDISHAYPNAPDCIEPRAYQPEPLWEWTGYLEVYGDANAVYSGLSVANLTDDNDDNVINSDDIPDVVFISFQYSTGPFYLRAISGDDGGGIWTKKFDDLDVGGFISIGDINSDKVSEIVVPLQGGKLMAVDHTGQQLWTTDAAGATTLSQIVDLDHDGTPEIVAGRTVFSNEGVLLWRGESGGAWGYTFAADLDADGKEELVTGKTAYRADGSIYWDHPGLTDGPVAVADCDADGMPEVFVATQLIHIFEHDGTPRVQMMASPYGSDFPGIPAAADLDGDGRAEFVVAYQSHLGVFDCDGNLVWDTVVNDNSGRSGPAVFDFDGDGKFEIVHGDEAHLYIFNHMGETMFTAPRLSGTLYETPVIVDVNNDGHAELLTTHSYPFPDNPNIGLLEFGVFAYANVAGDWIGTSRTWNQGSYVFSNIDENGIVPQNPVPHWQQGNFFRGNYPICVNPVP